MLGNFLLGKKSVFDYIYLAKTTASCILILEQKSSFLQNFEKAVFKRKVNAGLYRIICLENIRNQLRDKR